jgi:single-strand DNA-binding protein
MTSPVTIVGNLTKSPELRFTSTGRAACSFGVAVNRRYQTNGEWQEQTSFFNVTCWAELAENAVVTLEKGTRVVVTGRLEQRSWDTPEGDKRSTVEIVADDLGPSLRWATAEVSRIERQVEGEG